MRLWRPRGSAWIGKLHPHTDAASIARRYPAVATWRGAGFPVIAAVMLAASGLSADTVLDRSTFADALACRQSDFLALNLETRATCALSDSDLDTRHPPWSSFKIPNAVIALETGAARGMDHWRDWNRQERPAAAYWPDAWRQGQTLGSAFERSTVWYFQDIAREIGASHYRAKLAAWGYGNAEVPDGSDDFWLGGPLALSVREQVHFIARLVGGELGVDAPYLEQLAGIAEAGTFSELSLHGKTGAGTVVPGKFSGAFEGWYVGWITETGTPTVAFAHYSRGADYSAIRTFRKDFALEFLQACGLVELDGP